MARKRAALAVASLFAVLAAFGALQPLVHQASAKTAHHSSSRSKTNPIRRSAALYLGLSGGSDATLTTGTTSSDDTWARRARYEGAGMVRLSASWAALAPVKPTDPSNPDSSGYSWTGLDQQITKLSAEGFRVDLVIDDAPSWAEGAHMPSWATSGSWKPNDADLKAFAHALATRYDGRYVDPATGKKLPRVQYWEAWNEPNTSQYLTPQWTNDKSSCSSSFKGARARSPWIYRGMQNAFYAGIKSAESSDVVLMAGLAPYSDPECDRGVYRMSPVSFMQQVFCLTGANKHRRGCNKVTDLDAINAHPYPPPDAHYPITLRAPDGDTPIAEVYKLKDVLHAAERHRTVYPRRNVGFWATEIGWDTNPPDHGGVTDRTADAWMNEGFYLLWKQGVRHILWYRLADIPNFNHDWPGGSGLFTSTGHAKPIAISYRFLFMTHRLNRKTVEAWGRAPVSGTLRIEQRRGKHWHTVRSGHVNKNEVFRASIKLTGSARFRAQIGRQTTYTWEQGRGRW